MNQTQGVYLISMVAETLAMHPQTLRKYERAGFIRPSRMGALRAYSDEDVAKLRLIKHLVEGLGLNLSGVEMALSFTGDLLKLRKRLSQVPDSSGKIEDSVKQLDGMLADLGIRVVATPDTQPVPSQETHYREPSGADAPESVQVSVPY